MLSTKTLVNSTNSIEFAFAICHFNRNKRAPFLTRVIAGTAEQHGGGGGGCCAQGTSL